MLVYQLIIEAAENNRRVLFLPEKGWQFGRCVRVRMYVYARVYVLGFIFIHVYVLLRRKFDEKFLHSDLEIAERFSVCVSAW